MKPDPKCVIDAKSISTAGQSIEVWRSIAGYEGKYEVSSLGNVWSVARLSSAGQPIGGHLMKPNFSTNGHATVGLCLCGNETRHFVHRLVLSAFVGPCPPNHFGLHRNDIFTENRVENLYYGTKAENARDAFRNGKRRLPKPPPFGSANWLAKLSEADVAAIRSSYDPTAKSGPLTKRGLAKTYGANDRQIGRILAGTSRQRG